ncbi:MAG: porin [Gammaproteobacteria bacterium HGW-Gammaproteobacteria-14]|nr:MAG: porin [Gammaproteobacteria bacterium HGW-Gammaproteobacteria-14]
MNKKLLAIAIGAVVAMPVAALADVTVYGRAHVSIDMLDDGADYNELNMSSNSSRLGFKAEKEAGDMTGFVQIEQQVDFDQGGAFTSARDTFVGLKGGFGMVRFGQFDTPFKAARGPANLFGDQVGDMRNLTRVGNGRFDERSQNTIHFQTSDMEGLRFNLAYTLGEGGPKVADAKDEGVSASVTYKQDALDVALAFEQWSEDHSRGDRDGIRLAAGYGLTDDLKLVGFFQTIDHIDDTLDADVLGLGAEYKLSGKTAVKGMFMTRSADPDDADSSLLALGVEHRLDRSVRVYANYAMVMNDDNAALTPWGQARTAVPAGAAGEDASGLSLGLRVDF